jgi:chromosome segregation ATPase
MELLLTRIRALERAKEEAVQSADALAAQLSFCTSLADKEKNLASKQHAKKLAIREEHVASLQKQLSYAHSQAQQASHQAREASAAEAAYISEIQQLNANLKELKSHLQCVTTECNSMKVELSSHSSGSEQHRHAAVDARDAAIKDYFIAHVMPQLRNGCATTCHLQQIQCQVIGGHLLMHANTDNANTDSNDCLPSPL